jgi:hypothetical protein
VIYAFTTGVFQQFYLENTLNIEAFHGLGMNASSGIRKIMFSVVELLFCFSEAGKKGFLSIIKIMN